MNNGRIDLDAGPYIDEAPRWKLRGRLKEVHDAARAIAARGGVPTAAAIAEELGDTAPGSRSRTHAHISRLRKLGIWPYGTGRHPIVVAVPPESRSGIDAEIAAISRCVNALDGLGGGARGRVWRFLADRYAGEEAGRE